MFQSRVGIFSDDVQSNKIIDICCKGNANDMSHFTNLFIDGRGYFGSDNKF